jgi:hypothetical protein
MTSGCKDGTRSRLMEQLLTGRMATLLENNPAKIAINGETTFRTSEIYDLLRIGLVEVAGPCSWRAKTCAQCKLPVSSSFACCASPYA